MIQIINHYVILKYVKNKMKVYSTLKLFLIAIKFFALLKINQSFLIN